LAPGTLLPTQGDVSHLSEPIHIRDFLGIPLLLNNRAIGTLNCFTKDPREFRGDEIRIGRNFADQAAIALENTRAYEELRVRAAGRDALRVLTRDIMETPDISTLFHRICESVDEILRVDLAHFMLVDEPAGVFKMVGSFGETETGEITERTLPLGQGIVHRVVSSKRPVAVREVLEDPAWIHRD
jgi:hypothetical protein